MEDQIITEQIDVVVIGDRKYELVSLMLEKELLMEETKQKHTHHKYLELLHKLVGDPMIPESSKNPFGTTTPAKFTKVILTNSFWLHIHFFVQDNKVFDPFVSQACKGPVNICIIAASEGTDLTASKAYLLQQSTTKALDSRKEGGIVRP